jgi:excisionase family DNA binding protein
MSDLQNPDRILTAAEAADLLHISRKTLYHLVGSAQIPGRKIGRSWRFRLSDLLQYVSGTERHPAEEDR